MTDEQTARVTKEEGSDGVKFNIVIPNGEANIHLILEEDQFISLLNAIAALGKEEREKLNV